MNKTSMPTLALWAAIMATNCHRSKPEKTSGSKELSPALAPPGQSTTRSPSTASMLGALAWQTPVYETPSVSARTLGYLRSGMLVALRPGASPGGEGCPGTWRPVAPAGFVCLAPNTATEQVQHETFRVFHAVAPPSAADALPYAYAITRRPGPVYGRVPTREQAEMMEPGLPERVLAWANGSGEDSASFRPDVWLRGTQKNAALSARDVWEQKSNEAIPWFLEAGRAPPVPAGAPQREEGLQAGTTQRHNGFAFATSLVADGRRYAVTPDLLLVPVDRLRPITGSAYHGVDIPRDITMPFGLVRVEGVFSYRQVGKGLARDRPVARRTAIKLTGKQNFFSGRLHYEAEDGTWFSDSQLSRLDPAKKMPKWAKEGGRWIDINITKQTLVAYEGTNPVFATLVSTGEAGLGDPTTTRATKRGIFRVHTKHLTATMNSEEVGEAFELRDIPYVQYFEAGYALHAAYWHDDFGRPRSHGCINLAPADARRLFFWTDPPLPEGWHTVREPLRGSVVFVHP